MDVFDNLTKVHLNICLCVCGVAVYWANIIELDCIAAHNYIDIDARLHGCMCASDSVIVCLGIFPQYFFFFIELMSQTAGHDIK